MAIVQKMVGKMFVHVYIFTYFQFLILMWYNSVTFSPKESAEKLFIFQGNKHPASSGLRNITIEDPGFRFDNEYDFD